MKKLLVLILTLLMIICSFGLVACTNSEPTHTHIYNQKVTTENFIATYATCTEKAKYYYSCKCGAKESLTFEYGDPLDHNFTNYVSNNDAKCLKDGTETATCDRTGCNEKDTRTQVGSALDHNYSILKKTATEHWHECECGAYETKESHKGGTATYTEKAKCEVCETEYGELEKSATEGLVFSLINNDTEYEVIDYIGTATEVIIPDTYNGKLVTSIGNSAFYNCDSLTSIVIPNSVEAIGYGAFSSCDRLTSITIGNSVTNIGYEAFSHCYNLTSIVIPNSVEAIGEFAFSDCYSLTSIEVSEQNSNYKSIDGVLYSKDGTTLICYPIGKTATKFTIPNSVTNIGDEAFRHCDSLTSIVIPNSVTNIGNSVFESCDSLTSIVIPNSVEAIGEYAFLGCDSLQYNIEGNLKYLGNSENPYLYLADTTSTNITSATINVNCRFIGNPAFYNCYNLTSIVIPNSVTSIGNSAFYNCDSLTSIVIPNSVEAIGYGAFEHCDSLQYNLEGNLKYLGNNENPYLYLADTTSTDITSATINANCRFIGAGAFSHCYNLTSVVIPESVESIWYDAFSNCDSLTIYCEANSKPSGWSRDWNSDNRPVVWGYKG